MHLASNRLSARAFLHFSFLHSCLVGCLVVSYVGMSTCVCVCVWHKFNVRRKALEVVAPCEEQHHFTDSPPFRKENVNETRTKHATKKKTLTFSRRSDAVPLYLLFFAWALADVLLFIP